MQSSHQIKTPAPFYFHCAAGSYLKPSASWSQVKVESISVLRGGAGGQTVDMGRDCSSNEELYKREDGAEKPQAAKKKRFRTRTTTQSVR